MKNKFDSIRVALFTFFGFFLMFIVYSSLTRLSVSRHDSYNIKALFSDLKQLQIGDDVRVAGVRVGSVTHTYLNKGLAVAVLNIEKKYTIPSDSVATILMAGLLGANYISIVPGPSKKDLEEGAYIDTQRVLDVSAVVQKFGSIGERLDRILAGFEGEDKGEGGKPNLFQAITNFFQDNKDKLNQIVDHVSSITSKISNGQGTLGRLIYEDQAYNDFLAMINSIKAAANNVDGMLKNFNDISKDIKEGDGLLAKLISDQEIAMSFKKLVNNLQEFSTRLNSADSTLGRIISSDDLYKKAESALDKVDRAVDGVANSGPITAVGAAASALF